MKRYKRQVNCTLESPTTVCDILFRLNIQRDSVQLAMVHRRAVSKDAAIRPGGRLTLFFNEYPIFIDWKNFRF
jgi:hypothetical protein